MWQNSKQHIVQKEQYRIISNSLPQQEGSRDSKEGSFSPFMKNRFQDNKITYHNWIQMDNNQLFSKYEQKSLKSTHRVFQHVINSNSSCVWAIYLIRKPIVKTTMLRVHTSDKKQQKITISTSK